MEKKYILHPGYIHSINDGDRHYISAPKLAELYNVSLEECYIIHPNEKVGIGSLTGKKLIDLYPRRDGNYKLDDNQ